MQGIKLNSGNSWKEEYKRLTDSVPCVEYKCITEHNDEVLHVSFSHDGTMFCTCSKDATVQVFNANQPFEIMFREDLGENSPFRWSYTQFSQFNSCDLELLVSGRCDGSETGEIIVYGIHLDDFELQARIRIQPYDVMGTWLNESYILSSRCHHRPLRHCLSEILLNKSSQEVHNLRQSIVNRLYMFKNEHANAVSYLRVADMTQVMSKLLGSISSGNYNGDIHEMHLRILLQQVTQETNLLHPLTTPIRYLQTEIESSLLNNQTNINTSVDFLPPLCAKWPLLDEHACDEAERLTDSANVYTAGIEYDPYDHPHISSAAETDAIIESIPMSYKILLAFTGMDMNSSHQIAIKFITQEKCDDVKPVNIERERRQSDSLQPNGAMLHRIMTDQWDHVIDVAGQLVGMEISPCGQYLFASYRRFSNVDSPEQHNQPNISSTVTISVFDLVSMAELMVLNGPTAVSSVFYLYLSCAGEYVASGSEDNQGYLWNKYYGCLVSKLKHDNVVNCVAINPCDTSMAVSVSDDHTIRIWRSKGFVRSVDHSDAPHVQDSPNS